LALGFRRLLLRFRLGSLFSGAPLRLRLGFGRGLGGRLADASGFVELDDRAARRADLLRGALRELLRAHGQRLRELPVAEDLEERRGPAREAAREDRLEVDGRPRVEALEELDVEHRVVRPEARVREAALRNAPVERHLSALVAGSAARARALAPAFVT